MGWIERKEVLGVLGRRKESDEEMGLFELEEEEKENEGRETGEREKV